MNFDFDTIIASVKKTNRMVVLEEGWRAYGIGAEISSRVTELAVTMRGCTS